MASLGLTDLLATVRSKLAATGAKRPKFLDHTEAYRFLKNTNESDDDVDEYRNASQDSSKLLSSSPCAHCGGELYKTKSVREGRQIWLSFSGWILSGILILSLTAWIWFGDRALRQKCFSATSSYSPLLDRVPNTLIETRRNGSIRWDSPYRGPPSKEVDWAWERISIFRPLNIQLTEEEYLRIGKSPETAARNAPEWGGGFFLQPEFSHQLHCVNLLRKASHFKYAYYKRTDPDFRDKDETFKVHLDHCVEMLRQFVMCHADVGVVTAHWMERRARPWPDFNTHQTCRDFDGIWQWAHDHQLPEGAPMMPLKPEGAKALSSPP